MNPAFISRLGTGNADIPAGDNRFPVKFAFFSSFSASCLLLLASCASEPKFARSAPPGLPVDIPFDFFEGQIYLKARVNGSAEKTMLLDSGAPWSVVDRGQFTNLSLPSGSHEIINLVTRDGVKVLPVLDNVEFAFDEFRYALPLVEVPSLPPFHQAYAGLIGYDFFREFTVKIFYQGQWVHLEDPRKYHLQAGEIEIPLEVKRKHPVVEVVLKLPNHKQLKAKCEIDTGFNGGLALFRSFAAKNGLYLFTRKEKASHGTGFVGAQDADPSSIREFRMGPATVSTIVTVLDGPGIDPGEGFDGLIGNAILRSCTVTFDVPHHRLLLKKVVEWDPTR